MITELIETLAPQEKAALKERITLHDTHLNRFIGALLDNPGKSKEELKKEFGINENTYFKNLSLVKDEIYDVIKANMKNAYDDLLLPNVLYKRGLEVHASKLRINLEEDYERQGWWNVLQEFYNLEMVVAYAKCDVKWLEKIKNKAIKNIDRLHQFVKVDREMIVQMAIIEKGDLKEKDFAPYAKKVTALLRQAEKAGHNIPVFNGLHSLFVLYTRYLLNLPKAKGTVKAIQNTLKKYEGKMMMPYASNVAWLNTMGFHATFATGEKPDAYFKKVDAAIGRTGLLYDAQALSNFCNYYFMEKDTEAFNKRFEQFLKLPTDKSFKYQTAFMCCMQAYLYNDAKKFNQYRNDFYSDDKNRAYDDYDLTIRYLEILLLLKDENHPLAMDKLEAAIKFTRRNFTTHRVKAEKQNWDLFRLAIQKKPVKAKGSPIFRITEFIKGELE